MSKQEPIAIVGIGCRLPGNVSTTDQLWELLLRKESGHCVVPPERFNIDGFYCEKQDHPATLKAKESYFIQEDVANFDNAFFGINNLEAISADPLQRKLLEVTYEALENAGVPLEALKGSNTGVYIGSSASDFRTMQYTDPLYYTRFTAIGASTAILANRITYCFDISGPSLVVDTACSSSLYALHLASIALSSHECDGAFVGGANLILSPAEQLAIKCAGVTSPDAVCKSFDASADGYGRGEGICALYMLRLSDALQKQLPVRAVIRGTAVNANGRTDGITFPGVSGQEKAMIAAYKRARLNPRDTPYVEAHATGTRVGDPIEIEAISRVFGKPGHQPTLVGSIKPNIGHTEACSGLAGVIKCVLALESRIIPPTRGIHKLNPALELELRNLSIATEASCWPKDRPLRASVNSFGFGGANSHVVLEAAPFQYSTERLKHPATQYQSHPHSSQLQLLVFSAENCISLQKLPKNIADYAVSKKIDLSHVAFTLGCHRSQCKERGYAITKQSTFYEDLKFGNLITGSRNATNQQQFTFVFTGQGAQWSGMGRELMFRFPLMRMLLKELDSYLMLLDELRPTWDLEGFLLHPEECENIDSPSISQPLCTAIQIILVKLLVKLNIKPIFNVGHSSGEIGAAYASGYLSARQAILIAYLRGYAVSQQDLNGAMLVVGCGSDSAQQVINDMQLADQINVACFNSPESTTLSGGAVDVEKLSSGFQALNIWSRTLRTGGAAYHSPRMTWAGDRYRRLLNRFGIFDNIDSKNHPSCMISTVTGDYINKEDITQSDYWVRNLESPVRFESAIRLLFQEKTPHIIEIGPHPSLKSPLQQIARSANRPADEYLYDAILERNKNSLDCFLQLVGQLFLDYHKLELRWLFDTSFLTSKHVENDNLATSRNGKVFGTYKSLSSNRAPSHRTEAHEELSNVDLQTLQPAVLVDLPSYPWNYDRILWAEPRASIESRKRRYPYHELLGSRMFGGNPDIFIWKNFMDINKLSWLRDHRFGKSIFYPGAAYIVMAIQALLQARFSDAKHGCGIEMRNIRILKALEFSNECNKIELLTELRSQRISGQTWSRRWCSFEISSITEAAGATIHCNGLIAIKRSPEISVNHLNFDYRQMEAQNACIWYNRFAKRGFILDPQMQSMLEVFIDRKRRLARAAAKTLLKPNSYKRDTMSRSYYLIHPISIDALLQTCLVASTTGREDTLRTLIPTEIGEMNISGLIESILHSKKDQTLVIKAETSCTGFHSAGGTVELADDSGHLLVQMNKMKFRAINTGPMYDPDPTRQAILKVAWRPDFEFLVTGGQEYNACLGIFANRISVKKFCHNYALRRLAAMLDLTVHKWPNLKVLRLLTQQAVDHDADALFDSVLRSYMSHSRYKSYSKATCDLYGNMVENEPQECQETNVKNGNLASKRSLQGKFDLLLIPQELNVKELSRISQVKSFLSESAIILCRSSQVDLERAGFTYQAYKEDIVRGGFVNTVALSHQSNLIKISATKSPITIVYHERVDGLEIALEASLVLLGFRTELIAFGNLTSTVLKPSSIVLVAVECKKKILKDISENSMANLKIITNHHGCIIWLTEAKFLDGAAPDCALVLGLARVVNVEQPSIKFSVLCVDNVFADIKLTARNIGHLACYLLSDRNHYDLEFVQQRGVIHSSRFEPDDHFNDQFNNKQTKKCQEDLLRSLGPLKLSIQKPGQFDTLHFEDKCWKEDVGPNYVEVEIKSVGINAKDVYVLSGRLDTKDATCALECTGIVREIGPSVTELKVGDPIVAMGPFHFGTVERFPDWACAKLLDDESFTTLSVIPVAFSTVLYALKHRVELKSTQSILIHSAAGGVGMAAIQYAQFIGAKVFATTSSDVKRDFLVQNFGLMAENIFYSEGPSFLPALMNLTCNRGVDVVLNFLTGELLHESLKACANFGSFIEIGKRDILDNSQLDMSIFERNLTFVGFDLANIYLSATAGREEDQRFWNGLLNQSLDFVRSISDHAVHHIQTFDISDITQAYRHFSNRNRIGKVAVSLNNTTSKVKRVPSQFGTKLDPEKSYLMVGCLSGLGRSISRWMFERGARHFVFLGRSGATKWRAKMIIEDLASLGAVVDVVQGDVSLVQDVDIFVSTARYPIGGVVQASMSIHYSIWSQMSHQSWNGGIDCKVKGTWHIHNALSKNNLDSELEFFVLMSSVSGTCSAVTLANYCAANAFLDNFARFRASNGLPAIAIGLGMVSDVGYLHEHREVADIMLQKGVKALSEAEVLQLIDIALTQSSKRTDTLLREQPYDPLASTHMLTGLELTELLQIRSQGFESLDLWVHDPRALLLMRDLTKDVKSLDAKEEEFHDVRRAIQDFQLNHRKEAALDIIRSALAKKIARLLLLPSVSIDKALTSFGFDSLLAAELRGYVFVIADMDISFMTIMAPTTNIMYLADIILEKFEK